VKHQRMATVYLIALGAFALGMASYVIAGLVPMVVSDFGVSVAKAGQLVTAFTLAYGIGSPVFVALLPAHKQRLGLLVALAIFTIANLVSALVTTYTALVITRIFAGVGAGVYLAMGIAASAAVVPKDKRGQALALIMGGMASGTVLGVPAGLMIAEQSLSMFFQSQSSAIPPFLDLIVFLLYFHLCLLDGFWGCVYVFHDILVSTTE